MKLLTRKETRKMFTGVSLTPQDLLKILVDKGFEFLVDVKTPNDANDGWYFDFGSDDVVWDGTHYVFTIEEKDQMETI